MPTCLDAFVIWQQTMGKSATRFLSMSAFPAHSLSNHSFSRCLLLLPRRHLEAMLPHGFWPKQGSNLKELCNSPHRFNVRCKVCNFSHKAIKLRRTDCLTWLQLISIWSFIQGNRGSQIKSDTCSTGPVPPEMKTVAKKKEKCVCVCYRPISRSVSHLWM